MSFDEQALRKEALRFFEGTNASHDWEHVERVFNLAVHIAQKENAGLNVVKAAALLHDIGRKAQDESNGKVCHAAKGAELSREILERLGYPTEFTERVVHCVAAHRFSKNDLPPASIEAKVLYDADKLDRIGAVGIGRAFMFAANVGARLHNHELDVEKTDAYSHEDTAYRDFMTVARHVKDKLLTSEGRRIAVERHDFMQSFFNRLSAEVDGRL